MFSILRNNYLTGTLISGTDAIAAAISAGTLISGDILLYALESRRYGVVNGNAVTLATN